MGKKIAASSLLKSYSKKVIVFGFSEKDLIHRTTELKKVFRAVKKKDCSNLPCAQMKEINKDKDT